MSASERIAPERIWLANADISVAGRDDRHVADPRGFLTIHRDPEPDPTPYIRADIADATLAALKEARKALTDAPIDPYERVALRDTEEVMDNAIAKAEGKGGA